MLETHTELYHRVTWYTELTQFHLCFFSKDKKEKELMQKILSALLLEKCTHYTTISMCLHKGLFWLWFLLYFLTLKLEFLYVYLNLYCIWDVQITLLIWVSIFKFTILFSFDFFTNNLILSCLLFCRLQDQDQSLCLCQIYQCQNRLFHVCPAM